MTTQAELNDVELSDDVILDRLINISNAMLKKDYAKVEEIAHTIPLTPSVANQMKHYMDKNEILGLGFDMSLVEKELGKDWYEKP